MVGSLELPKVRLTTLELPFRTSHSFASQSPRIGSPPIFPRPKSAFVDPAADSIHAFLPSEVSAYPSSPRGADYLRAEWEREGAQLLRRMCRVLLKVVTRADALSLPPSSPPTSTRSEKVNGPQQVWSSSQVGELPLNDDLRIGETASHLSRAAELTASCAELPAFGREKQIKSAQIEAERCVSVPYAALSELTARPFYSQLVGRRQRVWRGRRRGRPDRFRLRRRCAECYHDQRRVCARQAEVGCAELRSDGWRASTGQ